MSGEKSKLREKYFSSLNRNKSSRKIGKSPIPINKLTGTVDKGYTKDELDQIFTSRKYSPNEAIEKSERLRQQFESEFDETPTKKNSTYIFNKYSPNGKDSREFGSPRVKQIGISGDSPITGLNIISIDHNGKIYKPDGDSSLELDISSNDDYIMFRKDGMVIDKLVFHKIDQLESLKFGHQSILFALKHNRGYVYVRYLSDDKELWEYFRKHKLWNVNQERYLNERLLTDKDEIIAKRYGDDNINDSLEVNHTPTKRLSNLSKDSGLSLGTRVSPYQMYNQRTTRSKTKQQRVDYTPLGDSTDQIDIFDDDISEPREKPAQFDPPLKYVFSNNKTFTISYLDFKTLYNNDWINDSIIDFFINYEMEKAIFEKEIFTEKNIYAFSSFFFTKLMDKNMTQDTPDYYQNVKRWFNKVDIMSYPYVIIPINEHAHWYCCIIKGLPNLLERARQEKESASKLKVIDSQGSRVIVYGNNSAELTDPGQVLNSQESKEEDEVDDDDLLDMSSISTPETPTSKKPRSYKAEIFIFDSLSQKHTHVHYPLKKVIIDYCKEKFDVNIRKDQIRVQNARVPKQNNFNDCGIHVIYNVRKWLNNSTECERLWRSFQSKHAARAFFLSEERNGIRKELINVLLELHKAQMDKLGNQPISWKDEDYSDDEVEVIEYNPEPKTTPSSPGNVFTGNGVDIKTSRSTPLKQDSHKMVPRTLDPKAQQNQNNYTNMSELKNDLLQEKLSKSTLSGSVLELLNKFFPEKNTKLDEEQFGLVVGLVENINNLHKDEDYETIKEHIQNFQNKYKQVAGKSESSRPKNQSFRIEHDKGIAESTEMSDSDAMYDDLTHLHLSDNSESNIKIKSPSSSVLLYSTSGSNGMSLSDSNKNFLRNRNISKAKSNKALEKNESNEPNKLQFDVIEPAWNSSKRRKVG